MSLGEYKCNGVEICIFIILTILVINTFMGEDVIMLAKDICDGKNCSNGTIANDSLSLDVGDNFTIYLDEGNLTMKVP